MSRSTAALERYRTFDRSLAARKQIVRIAGRSSNPKAGHCAMIVSREKGSYPQSPPPPPLPPRLTQHCRSTEARAAASELCGPRRSSNGRGRLDDRFHETGLSGTGSLLVDSSFAIGWTRIGVMAGWRYAVELAMSGQDIGRLMDISRSRTERATPRDRSLQVHLHAQARLLAQSRRGLLLQIRPLRLAPHPGGLKIRAQAAHHRRHQRCQSPSGHSHLVLQARRGSLI